MPHLTVANRGELPVLLLDGEEIRGAKQNRVLNTSILVAPMSKCTIPVSCTEQGRWNYTSKHFEDSGVLMARSIRFHKQASVSQSVRESHGYASNQGEVWREVAELHQDLGTSSKTGAMRDAYESKKAELDDYVEAFSGLKGQSGIAVFLEGQLVGVDFISYVPAMDDLLPKLIGSYAMDALRVRTVTQKGPASREAVTQFLGHIGRCTLESHPSPGLGWDARLEGKDLQGAALIASESVIHLSAFAKLGKTNVQGRMSSFSHRRNFGRPF